MTDQELDIGVGTKTKVALSPKKVEVADVTIETKHKKGTTQVAGKLLEIAVLHPDKPEQHLIISKVKIQNGDKLKTESLWVNTDDEGKLQKGSAIARLLTTANVATIRDLVGKELDTTTESDQVSYLVLKAY